MSMPVSTPVRELIATVNQIEVGVLRDEDNVWSFEYRPEWMAASHSFDLSPSLPRKQGRIIDGSTTRPVQWFFDNLLPEEAARDVLAKEAAVSSADAFGLLATYGKESAGAITLLAPGESLGESGYVLLSDTELHDRISKLPQQSLGAGAPKRMSNTGAQHKLAVALRDGQLFYPKGNALSTHILKPDHTGTDNYPNSVANEYFVMQLAGRLGLPVPKAEIRYVPDPVYLVERFDRRTVDGETHRLHAIDACQLLGVDRRFKYTAATVENLVRCIDLCSRPARARIDLFSWAVFNLLTGNSDAHLKNLTFLVSARGIELAPFYDLVSTDCYRAAIGNNPRWPETSLSTRIGHAGRFADVTQSDVLAFARQLGLNSRAAEQRVKELTERITAAADSLYEEFESLETPIPIVRESQLKALRSIRHIVIKDMVRVLSRPPPATPKADTAGSGVL
jgi:serine/threonine-protein kinase HipA